MTEMTTTQELLPCPFCGAHTAYTAPPALGKGRWVVQCDDCRAEGPTSSDNSDAGEAEAIAAWNTRPTTAPGVGLVGELRGYDENFDSWNTDRLIPQDLFNRILTALSASGAGWREEKPTQQFFVVWNEARNEGFITDDEADASACLFGVHGNGSTVGIAFAEAYDDDERIMENVCLPLPPQEAGQ